MELLSSWFQEIKTASLPALENLIGYLPSLFGAAALLAVGWLVAGLAQVGFVKTVVALDRVLSRTPIKRSTAPHLQVTHPALDLFGKIVFWAVILFFVKFATDILGLHAVAQWLNQVVTYLPTFLAGGIILIAGVLLSVLVRDLTITTADTAGIPQASLLGTLAQGATLITALVIGLDQIGIEVSFLSTLIAIGAAAFLGSLALAFGLGGRTFVSNLIGAHFVHKQYQVGQRVRWGKREGVILEFTPTSVVLATKEGRLILPASLFEEEPMEQLIGQKENE
ncbi:mechanosensitive ion channel family protein [Nitrospina gracilis]|uniref:mechanosensitive ion channel family protein n=1 Tax=Nitrospina gracilis TaxID=35801 RepID=UPI001EFFDF1A|nr:mechanosensitive ion channel [Nitrospina gracilis]MCF8719474.1 small-conductance mechanosensitive channel [Nitrospina gracilis Nb-211]